MSYQERRALVSAISTILITALYAVILTPRYPDASAYSAEVFRFWGAFFVILIPVTIVARIIIYILFSILHTIATREEEPSITDERDQLIELKATRLSQYVFGVGFILAMASLLLDATPTVMFLLIVGAGVVAEVVSELSQFYYYRRGF